MKQEEIAKVLLDKGYNEVQAKKLSSNLVKMAKPLLDCFNTWATKNEEKDFSYNGQSVKGLMNKFKMKYPAALLSLDWVIRDPKAAIKVINKGIK